MAFVFQPAHFNSNSSLIFQILESLDSIQADPDPCSLKVSCLFRPNLGKAINRNTILTDILTANI